MVDEDDGSDIPEADEEPRPSSRASEAPQASEIPRASEPPRASEIPRGSEIPPGEEGEGVRRKRLERLLRDTIRRGLEKGIEAGLGTISKSETAVREIMGDAKLPKEVIGYVFSQIDETKNALVRVVAREVREFLEATDLATELQKALTSLSFEIKTEVRFIPNDAGTGVRPDVRSRAVPKRKKKAEAADDEDPEGA